MTSIVQYERCLILVKVLMGLRFVDVQNTSEELHQLTNDKAQHDDCYPRYIGMICFPPCDKLDRV